jgi:hypothetical protein
MQIAQKYATMIFGWSFSETKFHLNQFFKFNGKCILGFENKREQSCTHFE